MVTYDATFAENSALGRKRVYITMQTTGHWLLHNYGPGTLLFRGFIPVFSFT